LFTVFFTIFNLAFEVVKFHGFWHFLVLNSKKQFPLMAGGGGKNRVLVYSLFGSFLEFLNIDEFKNFGTLCIWE
jgi:hypothetical protein